MAAWTATAASNTGIFCLPSNVNSRLVEFRENGQLRMISIIDELPDGISSVYTFFDPDVPGASFGTYNIIMAGATVPELKLPYLYLGYWIKDSRKMAYKAAFRPLQGLIEGQWEPLTNLQASIARSRCQHNATYASAMSHEKSDYFARPYCRCAFIQGLRLVRDGRFPDRAAPDFRGRSRHWGDPGPVFFPKLPALA